MKKQLIYTAISLQLCLTTLYAHPGHSHELWNFGVGATFFLSLIGLFAAYKKSKKKV